MKQRLMFWALVVVILVVVGALPAAANTITVANVTDTCSGYTITVAGKYLSKPAHVNYTITLTPTVGSPITISDSIAVTPHPPHGTWSGTNTQTWAHYGVTLNGTYTLTGTATLATSTPHSRKIIFTPSTITCTIASVTCLPSSSLGVLVQAPNVTSYVPNGAWSTANTGLQVVQLEPTTPTPSSIATPGVVNSCSSNSVTGETVCSSNGTDIYLITGSTLNTTLTDGADASTFFSGGACETCGVAMNQTANKAVLAIGISTSPTVSGLQFLDLASNTFGAPVPASNQVSEDILWDQGRNLVLSPGEGGVYDLFNTSSGGEFGNVIGGELDSGAEDCTTGIALSTIEFTQNLYIGDLTQATFTAGSPGTWTTPGQQVQSFPEFGGFSAGTSGIAVTPGSHLGVVTGEFCGNAMGAIQLPSTSGSGTPAVVDYSAAVMPNTPDGFGFAQGLDPHTVTAYLSPNDGKSYGIMANGCGVPPTFLGVIDLQGLLSAPRLAGTHTVDPTYDLILNGVVKYVPTI